VLRGIIPDGKLKLISPRRQDRLSCPLHSGSTPTGDPAMSKILSLLLASAALTAGLGVPAWSAMHLPQQGAPVAPMSAVLGSTDTAELLVLVDDDDDDDEDEGEDGNETRGASNDDEDDDDAEDCDDDDGSCGASTVSQAAPAGTLAPPQNGLFDTGTPQVQVK
jgi:hypothetical protein